MIDRLFLCRYDPKCAAVLSELDPSAAVNDHFRGRQGQELYVFVAFSPEGVADLLSTYDVEASAVPLLLSFDGRTITDVAAIVRHFSESGMRKV